MTERKQTCGNCRWRNHKGYCHRMPPTAVHTRDGLGGEYVIFPKVGEVHYCGEWQPPEQSWDESQEAKKR